MDRPSIHPNALCGALAVAIGLLLAAPAAGAGDPGHGKAVFAQQCAMCHTANKGGATILGPNLFGVVGRKAGSVAGYSYSPHMKAADWVWSDGKLEAYLPAPRDMVPGTKMTYGGLHDPAKLADLMAYLDSQK
jgi:cytochrome c